MNRNVIIYASSINQTTEDSQNKQETSVINESHLKYRLQYLRFYDISKFAQTIVNKPFKDQELTFPINVKPEIVNLFYRSKLSSPSHLINFLNARISPPSLLKNFLLMSQIWDSSIDDQIIEPMIVKSTLDDIVVTGTEAQKIINNLDNPTPEDILIRKKTLARAKEIYEKHEKTL